MFYVRYLSPIVCYGNLQLCMVEVPFNKKKKKNSTEVIITKDVAKISYSPPSLTRDIIIRASRVSDAGGDDGIFENGLTHRVMVSEETELMSHQVNVWVKLRRTRPQSNN